MDATQLDRETARALVEAGFMPLQRYAELFEEEVRKERAAKIRLVSDTPDVGSHRTQRWSVPPLTPMPQRLRRERKERRLAQRLARRAG